MRSGNLKRNVCAAFNINDMQRFAAGESRWKNVLKKEHFQRLIRYTINEMEMPNHVIEVTDSSSNALLLQVGN